MRLLYLSHQSINHSIKIYFLSNRNMAVYYSVC